MARRHERTARMSGESPAVPPPTADPRPDPAAPRISAGALLPVLGVALTTAGAWLLGGHQPLGWLLLGPGLAASGAGVAIARQTRRRRQAAREEAEAHARLRDRELTWLQRVAHAMVSGDQLEDVLAVVADAVTDLLACESAAIGFVVEEGRFVRIVAGNGVVGSTRGRLLPVDHSLLGWVVTHETAVTSPDMGADPRNHPVPDLPLTALAGVPLRAAGVVIGVLAAFNRHDGRPFTEADVLLLRTLADQVVVGLDRAHVLEESRRKEEVLAAKNRELLRVTELKSQFLANMSHELRTPLNAINGFSDLLLTGSVGPLGETQQEFLESILRNGKHLLGLINSILDLSKIEAGRMALTLAATDLRAMILGAVTDTAPLRTARRQTVHLEIGDAPLPALADGVRVRQILFNLLSNASKFTPEGGQIAVAAVATRAPLPVPAERSSDTRRFIARDAVWVSVRDTGIGIAPADMDKLFQEFTQIDSSTSRQQQGTGLGLVLSKRFVEMHGGTIGCESVAGQGAAFWFLIPAEGPLRRAAPAPSPAPPPRLSPQGLTLEPPLA